MTIQREMPALSILMEVTGKVLELDGFPYKVLSHSTKAPESYELEDKRGAKFTLTADSNPLRWTLVSAEGKKTKYQLVDDGEGPKYFVQSAPKGVANPKRMR